MHQQTTCPAGASACTPGNCPIKCPARCAKLETDLEAHPSIDSQELFNWLCDDGKREQLYRCLIDRKAPLLFRSRVQAGNVDANDYRKALSFQRNAYLLVHRDHLTQAYQQSSPSPDKPKFSNQPFQELGGSFMLAMDEAPTPPPNKPSGGSTSDPFQQHTPQRDYCDKHLKLLQEFFDPIATVAFAMGALLPLKSRNFDLADMAQQIAIRYVAMLFGYAQSDLPLLDQAGTAIGEGLQYQMMARHFVTKLDAIPNSTVGFAGLVQRSAQLIDLYRAANNPQEQKDRADLLDELEKLKKLKFDGPGEGSMRLAEFTPMMDRMAGEHGPQCAFSTTEKAILVAGLVGGAVTNIRASICIAIQYFFDIPKKLNTVKEAAFKSFQAHRVSDWKEMQSSNFGSYIKLALCIHPPAPFLPRLATTKIELPGIKGKHCIPEGSLILLGVGGGSWLPPGNDMITAPDVPFKVHKESGAPTDKKTVCPFHMVFGGRPDERDDSNTERALFTHSCFGMDLAMYVIGYAARQIMLLPGLAQSLDPLTGHPLGLAKHWGSYCDSYPLEYQREKLLRQSPLQTVLPIKSPVPENAEKLKLILKYGAAFIEKVLMDSKTIHFASFVFLENESKLALFTAYDGDYDAYIAHFAREFGPLFDQFFSCMEVQPPMPIRKHAFEFVQYLRQFQQPSVGGYFFSAYPQVTTDQIDWQFNQSHRFDLFTTFKATR